MPAPAAYNAPTPPETYYLGATLLTGVVPSSLPDYLPDDDVMAVYDACHGIGTKNKQLIKVLIAKTAMQAQVLQVAYKEKRQKELVPLLKSESSGVYKTALAMLASGSLGGDAYALKKALKSENNGSKVPILMELVVSTSKDELALFRNYLWATKQMDLDNVVSGAVAGEKKAVQEIFAESLKHDLPGGTLDLERDYATLKHCVTNSQDRALMFPILLSRPPQHLNQLAQRWCRETFNQSLSESISIHFKNGLEAGDLLLYAIGSAESRGTYGFGVWRDAQRIEDAISKKNELLLTVRLIRAHWDTERFRTVIAACNALKPGKASLEERVGSATSGNLKTLLKEMIVRAL